MDQQSETPSKKNSLSRRELLGRSAKIGLAMAGVGSLAGCGGTDRKPRVSEPTRTEEVKKISIEQVYKDIDSFSWQDVADTGKLREFTEQMGDSYLSLTNTTRITKENILGDRKLNTYHSGDDYLHAVQEVYPEYVPSSTQWGYTDYATGRVFLDLEILQRQAQAQNGTAGMALVDALWHEWGHLDVSERTDGVLLNNPNVLIYSPVSQQDEMIRRYRGGAVYTDTYYGMLRFDEVLNETVTLRRMLEEVKMPAATSAADYYPNGVNFFPILTKVAGISLADLYESHATSDFEGLASRIGASLPGEGEPIIKGVNLFTGIHNGDPQAINATGVFDILPK